MIPRPELVFLLSIYCFVVRTCCAFVAHCETQRAILFGSESGTAETLSIRMQTYRVRVQVFVDVSHRPSPREPRRHMPLNSCLPFIVPHTFYRASYLCSLTEMLVANPSRLRQNRPRDIITNRKKSFAFGSFGTFRTGFELTN